MVQSSAVNTPQVVMCIVVVYMHFVESLVSAGVNVTLHVAPLAVTVRVSYERDRNPKKRHKLRHTHCANFDVLLMGLFSVHALHCERLS